MKAKLSKTQLGLLSLLEKGKKDKNVISVLKDMAVKIQDYDLASDLRETERTTFPETKEEKKAKDDDREINTALRMVGITAEPGTAWILKEVILALVKKGNKFSLEEATKLETKKKELFRIRL